MGRFLPPLVLMGGIFFLSAQPDLSTGLGTWDLILRKAAHMGVFGLLAVLWWRALVPFTGHALPVAVLISFAYAITDEYHQSFIEGRHGSPIDVGVDAVGIGLAILLVHSLRSRTAWR